MIKMGLIKRGKYRNCLDSHYLLGRDNRKSKERKIKSRENQNRSRNMGKQVSEILESLLGEFKMKKR